MSSSEFNDRLARIHTSRGLPAEGARLKTKAPDAELYANSQGTPAPPWLIFTIAGTVVPLSVGVGMLTLAYLDPSIFKLWLRNPITPIVLQGLHIAYIVAFFAAVLTSLRKGWLNWVLLAAAFGYGMGYYMVSEVYDLTPRTHMLPEYLQPLGQLFGW